MSKSWVVLRIVDKSGNPLKVRVSFSSDTAPGDLYDEWTDSDGWTKGWYPHSYDGHTIYVWVGGRRIGEFVCQDGVRKTLRVP